MSIETPVQVVSSFVHCVTQWMSTVGVSRGSASSSSHVHETSRSTAPRTVKLQSTAASGGVGPTASTGKSGVSYWPGGSREGSAGRRPWKPRAIGGTPEHASALANGSALTSLNPRGPTHDTVRGPAGS